jgi:hypothetical protein
MTVLAIGPRRGAASWEWVGEAMASELGRDFQVVLFDGFDDVPKADVILIVKQRPSAEFVAKAASAGARIFFAPIDVYLDPGEIAADAGMLGACQAVLAHGEALVPALAPFCRKVFSVEHHARFALPQLAAFRTEGFLLWVGAFEHVPHVIGWLQQHPSPIEVRLLTDLGKRAGRVAGHFEAHRLGLSLRIAEGRINGHPAEQWSEAAQARLMETCRAAIDIKGDSFNQSTKPPTKAQQFVASGVPFGCNPGHPAAAYFRRRGFELADAADFSRLLSKEYWAQTQAFAGPLRERTSLEAVGQAYREILAGANPLSPPSPFAENASGRPCGC